MLKKFGVHMGRGALPRLFIFFLILGLLIAPQPTISQMAQPGQPTLLEAQATGDYWEMNQVIINSLGEGWTVKPVNPDTSYLYSPTKADGGITTITLPNALNGSLDLWLHLYLNPLYNGVPYSQFLLDGQLFDFVPKDGFVGNQWVRIKTIQITNNSYTFSMDDLPNTALILKRVKLESAPPPDLPPPPDLKGLPDIEAFGLYSAGLTPNEQYGQAPPGSQQDQITLFNQRRMNELQNLHVKDVFLELPDWYDDSDQNQASFHRFLDDLHAHGIRAIVKFTVEPNDWFSNDNPALPMDQWIFDTSEAEAKFRVTDRNRDGISDLDGRIDVVFAAHEVVEFANYAERVQIYNLAKQYFPHTPILMYYGGLLYRPFDPKFVNKAHPAGGLYKDYQFGPGETDIIHIDGSYMRPFVFNGKTEVLDENGNRIYDTQGMITYLLQQKQIGDTIAPQLPFWVHASFDGDSNMDTNPKSMWKPEEITGWASAILALGDIQGLFLRAYDRFTYDLGYGTNTDNPSIPETGWIEQRQTFKTIGGWILPTINLTLAH